MGRPRSKLRHNCSAWNATSTIDYLSTPPSCFHPCLEFQTTVTGRSGFEVSVLGFPATSIFYRFSGIFDSSVPHRVAACLYGYCSDVSAAVERAPGMFYIDEEKQCICYTGEEWMGRSVLFNAGNCKNWDDPWLFRAGTREDIVLFCIFTINEKTWFLCSLSHPRHPSPELSRPIEHCSLTSTPTRMQLHYLKSWFGKLGRSDVLVSMTDEGCKGIQIQLGLLDMLCTHWLSFSEVSVLYPRLRDC